MKIFKASEVTPPYVPAHNDVPPYVLFSFDHGIIRAASDLNIKQLEWMAPGQIFWTRTDELLALLKEHLTGGKSVDCEELKTKCESLQADLSSLEERLTKIRNLTITTFRPENP